MAAPSGEEEMSCENSTQQCQSSEDQREVVQENDHVIIRKNEVMKAFQVRKGRPVWIGKQKLDINSIIGHPYGSAFELKNKTLHRIKNTEMSKRLNDEDQVESISKDNRFLVDDGRSQKMTKDDIECLKGQGISGNDIVEKLVANSATFSEKNEFSQAKYLKKKQKKYSNFMMVLKPSTRLLAEMQYAHGPLRILNLRQDTLAQLLTLANVRSDGKYLVLESCLGLVTGAILERIGEKGALVNLYTDEVPNLQTVNMFNFKPEIRKNLMSLKVKELPKLDVEPSNEESVVSENDVVIEETNQVANSGQEVVENKDEKASRKLQRQKEAASAKAILCKKNLDGLLIATKFYPVEILMELFKYLDISRPFVVYSMHQEPLGECYVKLKQSGQAVSLRVTEMMTRHYQVLPDRTHPHVNISGSGGYLLSGIKVAVNKI